MTTQRQIDWMKTALAAFEEALQELVEVLEAAGYGRTAEIGSGIETHMWTLLEQRRWTTDLQHFIAACEVDLPSAEEDATIQDAWDAHVASREAAFESAYDAEHPGQDPCEWKA